MDLPPIVMSKKTMGFVVMAAMEIDRGTGVAIVLSWSWMNLNFHEEVRFL
jgi:hypothetical protein